MALTAQDVADAITTAGIADKASLTTFLTNSLKPVQRAAIQAQIDAENKAFAALQATHNATLATLQAQLNAI